MSNETATTASELTVTSITYGYVVRAENGSVLDSKNGLYSPEEAKEKAQESINYEMAMWKLENLTAEITCSTVTLHTVETIAS